MIEAELKFTSKEVAKILDMPQHMLKDLTRQKAERPPWICPSWPASGQGQGSDFYSVEDLVNVGIYYRLNQAGFSRQLIRQIFFSE